MLSCTFTRKIKSGEMAYERKQYAIAAVMLEEEYNSSRNKSQKARLAFLAGRSYIKMQEYEQALLWFENALTNDYGDLAGWELGQLYKSLQRYGDAIEVFENLKRKPEWRVESEREILLCRQASQWLQEPAPYTLERMFTSSTFSEYSPVLYDRDFILFASDRPEATGNQSYSWTGNKFSDLFMMPKNGSEVRKFDAVVNTPHNEGTACFTRDYNTIYFTRCSRDDVGDDYCKIMFSRNIKGVWAEAEDLPFTKAGVQYGHPALIENDSILVFTSDLSEPGGKFDLFYSILENDTWSAPEAMPGSINTDGNEKFPTADGDTLYFSSDFLPGMGGLDIFKTWLRQDRTWSPPQNLRWPINSGKDDFGYVIDRSEKLTGDVLERGFFSSNRNEEGKDDLYRYIKRRSDEQVPVIAAEDKPLIRQIFLTGRARERVYTDDNPDLSVKGTPPLSGAYLALYSGNRRIGEWKTREDGIYISEIVSGQKYTLTASAPGYLTTSIDIDAPEWGLKDTSGMKTINQDIVLEKIYYDREIRLSNIYYEFDRWELTPDARLVVDTLAGMLRMNPTVQIVLNAHTDCRGDDDYNLTLSQRRAQSVVDYLVTKGIDINRLEALGYGETLPAISCRCAACTEADHEANRRTTFMVKSAKK